jgi:thiol-disulfide isomerase/thioredoxin
LLAREVASELEGVRFVVEDLGASPLAERFGVQAYPALFVDDALVARPEDFYSWGGPETGKYLPWGEAASRRRFQADVRRMLALRLRGEVLESLRTTAGAAGPARLPDLALRDLSGAPFRLADLAGKPVIVEFWATWCPPCLDTLEWMKRLDPERVEIVAIAVESSREDVERTVARIGPPGRVVFGDAEVEAAFGGLAAVPALFIADRDGRVARTLYGAPPDLHETVESTLAGLGAPAADDR